MLDSNSAYCSNSLLNDQSALLLLPGILLADNYSYTIICCGYNFFAVASLLYSMENLTMEL